MPMWYTYAFNDRSTTDEIKAHVRVPPESPWFDGHFPGAPILPGIAQLGMVHDMLTDILGERQPVGQVSRVRFKQMIRPDQPLILNVNADDQEGRYRFSITGDDGLICSGQLRLRARKK